MTEMTRNQKATIELRTLALRANDIADSITAGTVPHGYGVVSEFEELSARAVRAWREAIRTSTRR